MVVSVSLMRNGYEYGTVPDRRGTIHTETSDDLDTPRAPVLFVAVLFIYGRTLYTCSRSCTNH